MQLPWDKRVARMWCTLFRNREEREEPGAFLTADARGNLRRIHDQFQKDHGLQLRHGTEPEMMWLKKGADGQPNGGYSNPYCYHIDQFESLRPVYMRVIEYCRKMGLDMIQGDHEDSPGQLELNFTYDDALRTADRLPPTARSARRSRASSTSSPASCASRSWACPPTAATTTSRCGRAARTR
jgi:glutamine synthetase